MGAGSRVQQPSVPGQRGQEQNVCARGQRPSNVLPRNGVMLLYKPAGSSWEKPQDERSREEHSGKCSFRRLPPSTQLGLTRSQHPVWKTKKGHSRSDILQLTLCSGNHRPFATPTVPERGRREGLCLPGEPRGRLDRMHMFPVRQGRQNTVKGAQNHPTQSAHCFSPCAHSDPTPKSCLLFSGHIIS